MNVNYNALSMRLMKQAYKRKHQKIRKEHFADAFADAPTTGYVIECGVGIGCSLQWIVQLSAPNQRIFGFDSFKGLPEDWAINDEYTVPEGSFSYDPPEIAGVDFRTGWFSDTLPIWKQEHPGRIAFLHIDADLYSSCVTILEELNNQIVPGTVIVFDEIYESLRYKNWEHGEYKAFNQWKEKYNRNTYQLGKTNMGEASFRIIE